MSDIDDKPKLTVVEDTGSAIEEPADDFEYSEEQNEAIEQALLGDGYVEETPTRYLPNFDKIETIEDMREFLKELGAELILPSFMSLEDVGKSPDWWVEVPPMTEAPEASNDSDTAV